MDPLYRNDRPGVFPESWYAATADIPPQRPALDGDRRADVCVIGAGFTGLSAALRLAEAGRDVVVLDAHRAGFGASGRNGGQVGSGFNRPPQWIEAQMGGNAARALWDMGEAAKALLRERVAQHAPEANYRPGIAHGAYTTGEAQELAREAEFLAERYDYTDLEILGRAEFADLVKSPLYRGGHVDRGAGHIQPLRYALGLARAAEAAGAVIYEGTEATGYTDGEPAQIRTRTGTVTADHVILAGNGYMPDIDGRVAARVMPINSFIAATAPLTEAQTVLADDIAAADSKFVVNYYRMEEGRFLFGGRESYSLGFPRDIGGPLRRRMNRLFPQLRGVEFTHVWGGAIAITMTRLPHVARLGRAGMSAAGFSGHGVALSGFAGDVMARAILGQSESFDLLSTLPVPQFPGGARFRAPLMTLAMTWYGMRDRLSL